MPRYKFHLANGRSLVLEGDTMPSDGEVEAAADAAGVRTLLMRGEPDAIPASNPTGASPDGSSIVGPLVGAGMAATPAVVRGLNAAVAPVARAVAPTATALAVANDLRQGNVRQAVYDGAVGAGASSVAAKVTPKIAGAVQAA